LHLVVFRLWIKPLSRFSTCFALVTLLVLSPGIRADAQSSAIIQTISVIPEKQGLNVQIIASRPVVPRVTKVEKPFRLVIDIPNAQLPEGQKRVSVHHDEVREIRASQFRKSPPAARVVVELTSDRDYSVVSAGNAVSVWLLAPQRAQQPATQASATETQPTNVSETAGEVASSSEAIGGAMVPARTLQGPSVVNAARDTAIVRLPRGGEVRVCPGTSLSLTPSQNGHDLMFGISSGAIEAHYSMDTSSDVILTPDFRILLPGPGNFNLAVSADPQGNTCVRGMQDNTASVIVSEAMGNGSYQVHPNEEIMFRAGRLNNVSSAIPATCGCPVALVPVMRAAATPTAPTSAAPATALPASSVPIAAVPGADPPTDQRNPHEVHVQVDAPLVFSARQQPVPPTPSEAQLSRLPSLSTRRSEPDLLSFAAVPPATVTYYKLERGQKPRHGLLGKLRGFFTTVFR
jgi:hypothetical protein